MSLKVKQSGNVLKIQLPLEKPRLSKSGKTMLVASTYGAKTTDVRYEGRRVVVVANAFIYPTKKQKED
jgi:hypothetical protein